MATNSRHMEGVTPADVFKVLSDGKSYGYWVVGTRMVREVTGPWPQPGGTIHYSVGRLPFRKDDITRSLQCEPEHRLQLEAHAWPAGTLFIEIELLRSSTGTTVVIHEGPKRGLLKTIDNPLVGLAIKLRNVETLRRLERRVREELVPAASV